MYGVAGNAQLDCIQWFPEEGESHVASAGFKVQSEATNHSPPPFFFSQGFQKIKFRYKIQSEMERCDHVENIPSSRGLLAGSSIGMSGCVHPNPV